MQGPQGGGTPLLLLKRKVKKMIDEEDNDQVRSPTIRSPLMLQKEGIDVTRRTVAKYREDMKIPSTHQRRVRN